MGKGDEENIDCSSEAIKANEAKSSTRRSLEAIPINSKIQIDLTTGLPVQPTIPTQPGFEPVSSTPITGNDMAAVAAAVAAVVPDDGNERAISPGDLTSWNKNRKINSYMWTDGLNYLQNYGYLNFTDLVINNAVKERKECVIRSKQNSYLVPDDKVVLYCGFQANTKDQVCDDISKYHFESV